MKKINIIAAAMSLVLLASCDRKLEFQHETFATFDAVSFSVDETVGKVSVPVSIYNPTGAEVQVTVKGVDGRGVKGVDYEIVSPASGILTFSGDVTSQNVEVAITDFSGEFTGSKDFSLEIASATDGVTVGSLNTAYFVVKDLDHPLSKFIGTWSGTATSYWGGDYALTVTISPDEADVTVLHVENLDPYFASYGYVSSAGFNMFVATAEGDQLIIEMGQPVGYGDVVIFGLDANSLDTATNYANIVFNHNGNGTMTIPNGYGVMNGDGYWECYLGGITLTCN